MECGEGRWGECRWSVGRVGGGSVGVDRVCYMYVYTVCTRATLSCTTCTYALNGSKFTTCRCTQMLTCTHTHTYTHTHTHTHTHTVGHVHIQL